MGKGEIVGVRGAYHGRRVTLDDVPGYVPQAFLAIEDQRFYEHKGIDRLAVIRAALANLARLGTVQGGGVTSFCVFAGGKNIYTDSVPLGGTHVTSDIARGLSTSLHHAERLKTLHGSAIATASDDQVMVDVPLLGEDEADDTNTVPRSMLVGVIRPRIEEIFEIIRSKMEMSGVANMSGKRVVLTGGASQLLGVREMASTILGKQVRLGRPRALPGLAEAVSGPAFATALGMLEYNTKKPAEEQLFDLHKRRAGFTFGFEKVVGWFRENF